jgi:hypothetical protein
MQKDFAFALDKVLNLDLRDEEEIHQVAVEAYRKLPFPNTPLRLVETAKKIGVSDKTLKLYAAMAKAADKPLDEVLTHAREAYLRVLEEIERIHNGRFQSR